MKKLAKVLLLAAVVLSGALITTSCATPFPMGCLYTQVTLPISVGKGPIKYKKVGEAKCVSILGWVASGNASVNAACRNGGIKYVSWANQKVTNILGIYGSYTTVVYGYGDDMPSDK